MSLVQLNTGLIKNKSKLQTNRIKKCLVLNIVYKYLNVSYEMYI